MWENVFDDSCFLKTCPCSCRVLEHILVLRQLLEFISMSIFKYLHTYIKSYLKLRLYTPFNYSSGEKVVRMMVNDDRSKQVNICCKVEAVRYGHKDGRVHFFFISCVRSKNYCSFSIHFVWFLTKLSFSKIIC